MDGTLLVVLGGVAAVGLALAILKLGRRLATGLIVVGGLAVVGAVALAMMSQAQATREAARAATVAAAGQAATSAAVSVIAVLALLVMLLLLAIAAAAVAWLWWRERQRHLETALVVELFGGPRQRTWVRTPRRHSLPQTGSVVLLPQPAQPPVTAVPLEQVLALLDGMPEGSDPMEELMPPPQEWRVL